MSKQCAMDLCPSTLKKIHECWQPHHFREVIKRARNTFKPIQHLMAVVVRIDSVMELGAHLEAHEALEEIKDGLMQEITLNHPEKSVSTHFEIPKKLVRILTEKNSNLSSENGSEKTNLLTEFGGSIIRDMTLKVFDETNSDKAETARRLGISKGRLVQRLISYGAYP
jgi:DNA-binding NtrC family response regulator